MNIEQQDEGLVVNYWHLKTGKQEYILNPLLRRDLNQVLYKLANAHISGNWTKNTNYKNIRNVRERTRLERLRRFFRGLNFLTGSP
jgi:hypothetical protein